MKKIGAMFLLLSSLALARGGEDIVEDRMENQLKVSLSKIIDYNVDYDVDIFDDKMNVEIEVEGLKEPKLDYNKITDAVLSSAKENAPKVKDINITVVYDQPIGEDKILFNKRFM